MAGVAMANGNQYSKEFKTIGGKCPPDCDCRRPCALDCCKKPTKTNIFRLIVTAVGILVALFATFMIVSSDSSLYLVFWVCYSVLRRLMSRSNSKSKTA